MIDDGIVDDSDVSHVSHSGVRGGSDAGRFTIEDDVVPDDRIGDDLDALSGVPDNVALDDVDPFAAAIDKNARILFSDVRIVNDVISDGISIRAEFDLDAVIAADAGAAQVVDVVAFHKRVCSDIRAVVGADVHALALRRAAVAQSGVMNVISSDNEGVAVTAVHRQGVVFGPADFALLERDVMAPDKPHTRVAALEMQAPNRQV